MIENNAINYGRYDSKYIYIYILKSANLLYVEFFYYVSE